MRIYLDTEFTDWMDPAPELISLAFVAEDGREFYGECSEFDRSRCTNFVTMVVLPLLGAPGVRQFDRAGLKAAVLEWLRDIPEPEIAVDCDGDWQLLCGLLGDDVPDALGVTHIYPLLDQRALDDYYLQHDVPKHHALHDARANQHVLSFAKEKPVE